MIIINDNGILEGIFIIGPHASGLMPVSNYEKPGCDLYGGRLSHKHILWGFLLLPLKSLLLATVRERTLG